MIKVLAKNPPAILFVLGFLLLVFGYTSDIGDMVSTSWAFIGLGVLLQVLWLVFTKG
ncbi:MAG: hypothetical protein U9O89_00315 [Thermoproteota archaeon]|nr:hypothetical protein [Thermoproteota archaeon]